MTRPRSSVWTVADQPARVQRQVRYLPASTAHPGKMLPALARQAISSYSNPGELLLDPMCGIGTTLVEATHLGRKAIGVELEQRWATLAAANLNHARAQGAPGHGLAIKGDACQLGHGLLDEYRGKVALILTSPPYGPSLHGQVRKGEHGVQKFDFRYSENPDNLAHLPQAAGRRKPSFDSVLAEILAGCRRMLAPNGHLVMTVRPYRRDGRLIDLPGQLEQLAAANGLILHDRHAALLCGLDGTRLVPRASFFQIRHQRSGAFPRMLIIAHEDVFIFRLKTPDESTPKLDIRLAARSRSGSGTR
jgi:SAM-dependent methyltransferase